MALPVLAGPDIRSVPTLEQAMARPALLAPLAASAALEVLGVQARAGRLAGKGSARLEARRAEAVADLVDHTVLRLRRKGAGVPGDLLVPMASLAAAARKGALAEQEAAARPEAMATMPLQLR